MFLGLRLEGCCLRCDVLVQDFVALFQKDELGLVLVNVVSDGSVGGVAVLWGELNAEVDNVDLELVEGGEAEGHFGHDHWGS